MDQDNYYSRHELTKVARDRGFKVGDDYFAQKAHQGDGPPYHIAFGRAYYGKTSFDEWLTEKLGNPFNSTADRSVQRHQDTNDGHDGSSDEIDDWIADRLAQREQD